MVYSALPLIKKNYLWWFLELWHKISGNLDLLGKSGLHTRIQQEKNYENDELFSCDLKSFKNAGQCYRCWWVNFARAEISGWPKVWSPSSPDKNPIDSSLWFFLEIMPNLPLKPIWNIRSVSFRRNGHKIHFFLPYFSVKIYEQTRVCYICYRLLLEKLLTNCIKQ